MERIDAGRPTSAVNSEILDRLPPQSLDAEKSVIGSLLLDSGTCDDVVLLLRPDDFYSDVHRKLYGHIVAMHDEGNRIDTVLLVERLKRAGDYEMAGGAAYLAAILQSVAVAAHAVYYAKIVRDKATLRSIIHASAEILRDAYDPTLDSRDMISQAEEKIFAIHDMRSSDQLASMGNVLVEAFKHIDQRMERGGATGVPTGLTDLDHLTGGLHESELGDPGGSSQHGQNCAGHKCRRSCERRSQHGHPVRQPGNVPDRTRPAYALCALRDQRQQSSARTTFRARIAPNWSRPRPS